MKSSTYVSTLGLRLPLPTLLNSLEKGKPILVDLPQSFQSLASQLYPTLNQRNISGFVGEVLKHAISSLDEHFVPNPHPDGRPDLLEVSRADVAEYLKACFESVTNAPMRSKLAPFIHGGIEIKCTIGNIRNAGERTVGEPRVGDVTGLNYRAHHIHGCDLLGIYYDYAPENNGSPQIKAAFYLTLREGDWQKVSTGNPNKKKTSNTSLNAGGIRHLYHSLVAYEERGPYADMLKRIGVTL